MQNLMNDTGPAHRTRTVTVRLTEDEYRAVQEIATRNACSGAAVMARAARSLIEAAPPDEAHLN